MDTTQTTERVIKNQIFFVTNTPLPNQHAHGIQIMQMCDAFAKQGLRVTLLVPHDHIHTAKDIFNFYSIKNTFTITQVPILRLPLTGSGRVAFFIRWGSFSFNTIKYLKKNRRARDIVYVRGEMILPLTYFMPANTRFCFETHIRPRLINLYVKAMRRCELIVTVTKIWASEIMFEFGIPQDKVIVEPDAVDLAKFNVRVSIQEARQKLGLPLEKIIMVYTGSDRSWKGLDVFKDAVAKLDKNYLAVFIGNIQKKYNGDSRFLYAGFQRHETIPMWLAAADFLILTGSVQARESERYTSPLKLFEYMAMKRPIIASDVPSFREILDENKAFLISTVDAEGIVDCIKKINTEDATNRAKRAFSAVLSTTWELRAKRILARLK